MFKGGDNKNGGHAEQIWDVQQLIDKSDTGVFAFQQIKAFCTKAGLDVSATVRKDQKRIAHGIAAISEETILSATLTSGSDVYHSGARSSA